MATSISKGEIKSSSSSVLPCSYCKKTTDTISSCANCFFEQYCGKGCQTKHWKTHKPLCKQIQTQSTIWRKKNPDAHRIALPEECFQNVFPLLQNPLFQSKQEGLAVTFGSGAGASSIYLLKKGWRVIATDYFQAPLDALLKKANDINDQWAKTEKLILICTSNDTYPFPKNVDLILAGDLPYLDPLKLGYQWNKISNALVEGGYLLGSFFETTNKNVERGAWAVKDIDSAKAILAKGPFTTKVCRRRSNKPIIDFMLKKSSVEQESPLILDRETRSNFFVLEDLEVQSCTLEGIKLKFKSQEQRDGFYQSIIENLAMHTHYTIAKQLESDKDLESSMLSLKLGQEAARYTSAKIRSETGTEFTPEECIFNDLSQDATEELKAKTRDFRNALEAQKNALQKFNLNDVFDNFRIATSLDPTSFDPYYIPLFLGRFLSKVFPKDIRNIIENAYRISPILTFNTLALSIGFDPSKDKDTFQEYVKLFFNQFPYDVISNIIATKKPNLLAIHNKEQEYRKTFSSHLEDALMAFREGEFEKARALFSKAEHYHISDKRPYMYKALIDLNNGDILAATKSKKALENLINWPDPEQITRARTKIFQKLGYKSSSADNLLPHECPENLVLKTLIDLFRSREFKQDLVQKFFTSMEVYLGLYEADLIWADFAMDAVSVRLANNYGKPLSMDATDQYGNSTITDALLDLKMTYIGSAFSRLHQMGENLSAYDSLISKQDDTIIIFVNITITQIDNEFSPIAIDPVSFQIPQEIYVRVLQETLEKCYNDFCLFFARFGGELDSFLGILEEEIDSEIDSEEILYPPFVEIFLQRMSAEGTPAQQARLLNWATHNPKMLSKTSARDISDYAIQWQLKRPIPSLDILVKAKMTWMEKGHSPKSDELGIASHAWDLLLSQKWNEANKAINPFFNNWTNALQSLANPIALRTLCLIKALLKDQNIVKEAPTSAHSSLHAALIDCTLSLLAREGVQQPFVLPNQPISKETTKALYDLYFGPRRNETEDEYLQRLEATRLPNLSDLRQQRELLDSLASESSQKGWILPTMNVHLVKDMRELNEEEIALQKSRRKHNQGILGEQPKYRENDPTFITWVTNRQDIALENPEKIVAEFKAAFPSFPDPAREQFFDELSEKRKHEERLQHLKSITSPVNKNAGKRFWQLVLQTAELIDSVLSGKRHEVEYDMLVRDAHEAHFVMKLIYEWSRPQWQGSLEDFGNAFHGPEIHVWGKGPRIPHFNAGVYVKGELRNVHIFFDKKKL